MSHFRIWSTISTRSNSLQARLFQLCSSLVYSVLYLCTCYGSRFEKCFSFGATRWDWFFTKPEKRNDRCAFGNCFFGFSNNECWEIPPVPGARRIVSATTPLSAPAAMELLGRRPCSASAACVGWFIQILLHTMQLLMQLVWPNPGSTACSCLDQWREGILYVSCIFFSCPALSSAIFNHLNLAFGVVSDTCGPVATRYSKTSTNSTWYNRAKEAKPFNPDSDKICGKRNATPFQIVNAYDDYRPPGNIASKTCCVFGFSRWR